MDDAHAEPLARRAERVFYHFRPLVRAQVADALLHPHGHVHRMPRRECLAAQVRNAGADQARMRASPRPACAFAASAPLGQREWKLS